MDTIDHFHHELTNAGYAIIYTTYTVIVFLNPWHVFIYRLVYSNDLLISPILNCPDMFLVAQVFYRNDKQTSVLKTLIDFRRLSPIPETDTTLFSPPSQLLLSLLYLRHHRFYQRPRHHQHHQINHHHLLLLNFLLVCKMIERRRKRNKNWQQLLSIRPWEIVSA